MTRIYSKYFANNLCVRTFTFMLTSAPCSVPQGSAPSKKSRQQKIRRGTVFFRGVYTIWNLIWKYF